MSTSYPSSSTSSSSSNATAQPQKAPQLLINSIPHIHVVMPPKGVNSQHTDERCFVYCSQSVAGRHRGEEPRCRSLCIRKVFMHEVRAIVNGLPAEVKYPLPPTGQKGAAYFQTKLPFLKPPDASDSDGQSTHTSADDSDSPPDWINRATNPNAKDKQYWQPGYYLFMSNRLVPTEQSISNMQRTLAKQTGDWQNDFAFIRRFHENPDEMLSMVGQVDRKVAEQVVRRVFATREVEGSILLPMPPTLPPIATYLKRVLDPTVKLLAKTKESVASGQQKELAGRIWEKAQSKDPFVLASNVLQKAWETLSSPRDGGDGEDDAGKRNKPT